MAHSVGSNVQLPRLQSPIIQSNTNLPVSMRVVCIKNKEGVLRTERIDVLTTVKIILFSDFSKQFDWTSFSQFKGTKKNGSFSEEEILSRIYRSKSCLSFQLLHYSRFQPSQSSTITTSSMKSLLSLPLPSPYPLLSTFLLHPWLTIELLYGYFSAKNSKHVLE